MRNLIFIIVIFSFLSLTGQKNKSISIPKVDTLHIKANFAKDTIYFKPLKENNEVKKESEWKIWLPTFTALMVLLVTNLVTLYKIRQDTKQAIKKEIIVGKIKIERERLEKFYDPIYTTLKINEEIFKAYGPQTFPKDNGVLETEASDLWKEVTKNVILINNKKIGSVIYQYSHLIDTTDSIDKYLEYSIHSESFDHFINFPNTRHKSFKYPKDFISHVQAKRTKVLKDLQTTENKLTT
jgi:hypothetical protein